MAGIKNGELTDADEVMDSLGSNFNDTAQMIFNADYIGFDSRLTNSTTPNLKNVFYSTFTSDDADTNFGFVYDSTNDLYELPNLSGVTEYIIIEATSLSAPIDENNVKSLEISSGKWLVFCTSGTDAVHRAQIIETLFGSSSKITSFTSVTTLQTSHSNDVGMQAHFVTANTINAGGANKTFTGTFINTSTNNNCSSWSNVSAPGNVDSASWQIPVSTTKNSVTEGNSSNEIGTDTSADENNNPATCSLNIDPDSPPNATGTASAIVLCFGDITWVNSGMTNTTEVDYFTDNSIPLMITAGSLSSEGVGNGTLIFKDTVTSTDNAIPAINSTIDETSSEQISISADGGSNFTNVNNAEIARPTAGTALWRKIVITRTDLSKVDKVTEQAVKFEFY